jgi:hypothetical protein
MLFTIGTIDITYSSGIELLGRAGELNEWGICPIHSIATARQKVRKFRRRKDIDRINRFDFVLAFAEGQ